MIEVQAISKQFGRNNDVVNAVTDVSFKVKEGEIYGLLGPNGAGKTTTIKMLVTLLAPTSGNAKIAGYDLLREPHTVRQLIGVALQETGLDESQTGHELVYLHSRLLGFDRPAAQQRVTELIELVGLTEAADRRLRTYSGGMKRRLDLALALVNNPRILFLDEPTTGLDPASRRAIWEEVEKLKNNGVTILLTTQYLEEADQLADRVGVIDEGQLAAEGTPEELKSKLGGDVIKLTLPADGGHIEQAAALLEEARIEENHLYLCVQEGAAEVPTIIARLQRAGISVQALTVQRPTLDDVFLRVTGRRLEGAKESANQETKESKESV